MNQIEQLRQWVNETPHFLTVYAVLADGTRWYKSYDVSEQLKASEGASASVTVDGLELPEVVMPGGFHVDIDDWNTINTTLPI